MPLRAQPRVGAAVSVSYLDARIEGVVSEVLDDCRRLIVSTEEGERIEFRLSAATAVFESTRRADGARLVFRGS